MGEKKKRRRRKRRKRSKTLRKNDESRWKIRDDFVEAVSCPMTPIDTLFLHPGGMHAKEDKRQFGVEVTMTVTVTVMVTVTVTVNDMFL